MIGLDVGLFLHLHELGHEVGPISLEMYGLQLMEIIWFMGYWMEKY